MKTMHRLLFLAPHILGFAFWVTYWRMSRTIPMSIEAIEWGFLFIGYYFLVWTLFLPLSIYSYKRADSLAVVALAYRASLIVCGACTVLFPFVIRSIRLSMGR